MKRLAVVGVLLTTLALLLTLGCGPPTQDATKVSINGRVTSEVKLGQNANWYITVKNEGPGDLESLVLGVDFGGLEFVSSEPPATPQSNNTWLDYGPFKQGETKKIHIVLKANEPGLAVGTIEALDCPSRFVKSSLLKADTLVK